MLINAFLLFGIDFRKYQSLNKITFSELIILKEKTEKRIEHWNKYGKQVFPANIQSLLNEKIIMDCQNKLLNESTIITEAYVAEEIVKEYLEDMFGNLNVKKNIKTSDIIISCNELGISLEIFDDYVSYKENKDQLIKCYPMIYD